MLRFHTHSRRRRLLQLGASFSPALRPRFARCRHQAIVLKGGTGVGKTVMVAQWLHDARYFAPEAPLVRVAVLVPRRAIAEGLAEYVARMRGCEVGEEVGVATGSRTCLSEHSRICFFTYGFFAAYARTPAGAPDLSGWTDIVLDEVHDAGLDPDLLLSHIGAAWAYSPDNKVVVMSATFDTGAFQGKLRSVGLASHGLLEVPGVTYAIRDEWWPDGSPAWDPTEDGAAVNLATEVLKICNREEGNVLVFVSTVALVNDCVDALCELAAHDPATVVLPLHARLDEHERRAVEQFADAAAFPTNAGKRMVCFSTNVAEAGITIPGLVVVVDTGREVRASYDNALRCSVMEVGWVSKASQQQRRGRAGRTGPGVFYAMCASAVRTAAPDRTKLLRRAKQEQSSRRLLRSSRVPPHARAGRVLSQSYTGATREDAPPCFPGISQCCPTTQLRPPTRRRRAGAPAAGLQASPRADTAAVPSAQVHPGSVR